MGVILDGKETARQIKEEIRREILHRSSQQLRSPHLAIFLVGDDPASQVYVESKMKDCKEVGIDVTLKKFSQTVAQEELLLAIQAMNQNASVDGIIVQLPLPKHILKHRVVDSIYPVKDVDGFHHLNFGRLGTGLPAHIPATPNGILELLRRYTISTQGLHVVVVGRSYLVGLPMSILLARGCDPGNATVTITHRHTQNLSRYTRAADVLISAVGKPGLIQANMVKKGAVVIDVGITRVWDTSKKSGYRLVGDVNFKEIVTKASYITPVPNGVGPMTRAALLMNTLRAASGTLQITQAQS